MKLIEKELYQVNLEIRNAFVEPMLNGELESFLLGPSKQIRSVLSLLYLKLFNININTDILKVLAAGEIIHNASLLHDDVIDAAKTRRGEQTLGEKYSPHIAILAGDYLLSHAIKKLLAVSNCEIVEIFRYSTEKMSKAEIEQYFLRGKNVGLEKYLEICKCKTALLFSAILQSCAILANLDRDVARDFAEDFGMIFQIKNDLDEVSAKQDKLNKISTAKDIVGIDKTVFLLDNYKEKLQSLIKTFPANEFKISLEDLIKSYVE